MKVLEALDYYLVVFHPYQSLSEYVHSPLLSPFQKSYKLHLFCLIVCVANREEMISSVNDNPCKIAAFPFIVLDVFHYIETLDQLYISLVRVLCALTVSEPIYFPILELNSLQSENQHSFQYFFLLISQVFARCCNKRCKHEPDYMVKSLYMRYIAQKSCPSSNLKI